MADKWDRSIKGDFKRAHDGKTAPPSEQKTRNASDYSKLNHLKDGPKPPLPKRPTPAPAPGQTMGFVPAPQKVSEPSCPMGKRRQEQKVGQGFLAQEGIQRKVALNDRLSIAF